MPFAYQPTLIADHVACPVTCQLVEAPEDTPYPASIVQSFTPSSLLTILRTSHKSLNGATLNLSLICRDMTNTDPTGYARNDFTVVFEDECERSNISPPMMQSYEIPLYTTDQRGFAPSQNSLQNCPAVYYVLNFPSGSDTPYFGLDLFNRIVTDPTVPANQGTFRLFLESCVKPAYTSEPICTTGPPFDVTVWDPCSINEITSTAFTESLSAPMLQSAEIDPSNLPWTTLYSTDLCGELEYQVLFNGQPVVNDWVRFDDGDIIMNPDMSTAPGEYIFELVARNEVY